MKELRLYTEVAEYLHSMTLDLTGYSQPLVQEAINIIEMSDICISILDIVHDLPEISDAISLLMLLIPFASKRISLPDEVIVQTATEFGKESRQPFVSLRLRD